MATRHLTRSLLTTKQSLPSALSHSYAAASSSAVLPGPSSFLFRLRPLAAAASASYIGRRVPAFSARAFSTRQTSSSLSDPNPNWSNRPPKETILLDGCDFEHWLVVVEKPEGDPTRDEIIDSYIKTLAMVIGSEEEARMKIYSVSTRHYYAFGALVSEELSYKLKELPKVRWVLPDSYLDVRNKDYGGEPFINGQAVPYDPKYHEEWVRNNARANERNRRNDRPRNFDRSRNFERRIEMQNSGGPGGPPPNAPNPLPNYGGGAPPSNPGNNPANNYGGGAPPNMALPTNAPPNLGPNIGGQSSYGGGAPPPPNYPTNNMRPPTNNPYGPGPNNGGAPNPYSPGPNNGGAPNPYVPGPNNGGAPFQGQHGGGSGSPYQSHNYPPAQNSGNFAPNAGYGPGPSQNGFAPNMGPGQNQY